MAGSVQTATAEPVATQAPTYYPFRYPRLVATYMTRYLNREADFDGVRATSVGTYQIVLRGYFTGINFKAHLHKVGTQRVQIQLWVLGQFQQQSLDVGYNV